MSFTPEQIDLILAKTKELKQTAAMQSLLLRKQISESAVTVLGPLEEANATDHVLYFSDAAIHLALQHMESLLQCINCVKNLMGDSKAGLFLLEQRVAQMAEMFTTGLQEMKLCSVQNGVVTFEKAGAEPIDGTIH